MLNNSFIHDGNNNGSTSTINFDYTKGGLSGSTTYYIWTAVRDLSGNVLSSASVKTQATLAAAKWIIRKYKCNNTNCGSMWSMVLSK